MPFEVLLGILDYIPDGQILTFANLNRRSREVASLKKNRKEDICNARISMAVMDWDPLLDSAFHLINQDIMQCYDETHVYKDPLVVAFVYHPGNTDLINFLMAFTAIKRSTRGQLVGLLNDHDKESGEFYEELNKISPCQCWKCEGIFKMDEVESEFFDIHLMVNVECNGKTIKDTFPSVLCENIVFKKIYKDLHQFADICKVYNPVKNQAFILPWLANAFDIPGKAAPAYQKEFWKMNQNIYDYLIKYEQNDYLTIVQRLSILLNTVKFYERQIYFNLLLGTPISQKHVQKLLHLPSNFNPVILNAFEKSIGLSGYALPHFHQVHDHRIDQLLRYQLQKWHSLTPNFLNNPIQFASVEYYPLFLGEYLYLHHALPKSLFNRRMQITSIYDHAGKSEYSDVERIGILKLCLAYHIGLESMDQVDEALDILGKTILEFYNERLNRDMLPVLQVNDAYQGFRYQSSYNGFKSPGRTPRGGRSRSTSANLITPPASAQNTPARSYIGGI